MAKRTWIPMPVPRRVNPAFVALLDGMDALDADAKNGDKALGESQAKFAARPRKKAGPRQRRVGG